MINNWERVKYFDRVEFDDPNHKESGNNIDGCLLYLLNRLRRNTGWPIKTHWEVGGAVDMDGSHGHSENSFHLFENGCKAVDFHFITESNIRKQIYEVIKSGFTGIGIYFCWNIPVGFHVDVRPHSNFQIWKCFEKGKYIYFV